jgi:hypothetical protein
LDRNLDFRYRACQIASAKFFKRRSCLDKIHSVDPQPLNFTITVLLQKLLLIQLRRSPLVTDRFGAYSRRQIDGFLPISTVIGANRHVRFTPESGHLQCTSPCPLRANSGHCAELRWVSRLNQNIRGDFCGTIWLDHGPTSKICGLRV